MSTIPEPIPPQYSALKKLHRRTALIENGSAAAAIVAPRGEYSQRAATALQDLLRGKTGVLIPILDDGEVAIPFSQNLILLGNRSTNKIISELYDRFFALTDLQYPGAGGYEIRSVHNPFGNGYNAIILGGDEAGVQAAAQRFGEIFSEQSSSSNSFSVEWLLEVKLARDIQLPPGGAGRMPTWQDSAGYDAEGYFGWNSLSKNMALYAMTGEPRFAEEFLRLAFPDAKAKKDIEEIDGERIENKNDPLGGAYHYNASRMILYWDLIEESPLFSDAQRLAITNGLARQFHHFCSGPNASWTGKFIYRRNAPADCLGSRHEMHTAISMFVLARYFARDYGDAVWRHALKASGENYFAPLAKPLPWLIGEKDNLFWYGTGLAPVLDYMILSGDRRGLESGGLETLLKHQELLWDGSRDDANLRYAALDYLNKAAYLTGDGRWLMYRRRVPLPETFRLDQSFWPDEKLHEATPDDLLNRWTVWFLPPEQIAERATGFSPERSFSTMSYRSAPDDSGDFILLDGLNDRTRNPYHTFALLHLRIAGQTLLKGYMNQLRATMGGIAQPKVALDAALDRCYSLGKSTFAAATVPDLPYCRWRRKCFLRAGKFAILADRVQFHERNSYDLEIWWQNEGHNWRASERVLEAGSTRVVSADSLPVQIEGDQVRQLWNGAGAQGEEKIFFSLISAPGATNGARLSRNAALFATPETVLVSAGNFGDVDADLAVRSEKYFCATALRCAPGFSVSTPVDVDWDFDAGRLSLLASSKTEIILRFSSSSKLALNGTKLSTDNDEIVLTLSTGEHIIENAFPITQLQNGCGADTLWPDAKKANIPKQTNDVPENLPALRCEFQCELPEDIQDAISVESEGRIYAATERAIHALDDAGEILHCIAAPSPITKLHWWPEAEVLLAGTSDQQILAYAPDGNLRWRFQSQMAPKVYAAAKTYWFNTARGHEGIHGLGSGVFLDGQSQLFVGSACTVEVLDEDGNLLHRLPQFWGPTALFQLVPAAGGSINLLTARDINDTDTPHVLNNRTLDPEPRGFYELPPNYTDMMGWTDQRRLHFFHADVDGDGQKEIISDSTGVWNRISTWDESGKPKSTIYFGPGPSCYEEMNAILPSLIRDSDVADIDGDGRAEIVTALSSGWIMALDGDCKVKWSRRLASVPTALKIVDGIVAVGQENGELLTLSGAGQFLLRTKSSGAISDILAAHDAVITVSGAVIQKFNIARA